MLARAVGTSQFFLDEFFIQAKAVLARRWMEAIVDIGTWADLRIGMGAQRQILAVFEGCF